LGSDEKNSVSTNLSMMDEATSVFVRALPLIETTLRRDFRVPREHARAVEEDIRLWFSRFALRPGSGKAEVLRMQLFCATCEAGRRYWQWRLGGAPVVDHQIRLALAREPEEMAKELEEKLQQRERREKRPKPEKESDS
jgi:hypothetical protein